MNNLTRRVTSLIFALAAILALAFVISPFDATLKGEAGIRAFSRTFNPVSAGLAVAAITVVIDGLTALLVAIGLRANPTLAARLERWTTRVLNPRSRKQSKVESSNARSWLSDLSLALGVGTGAVILKHPTAPLASWFRLCLTYTVVAAVVFGTTGWMVAGGANFLADAGFGWLREGMIRWVPDPQVWTAIFVVTVLGPFAYGEWLDRRYPAPGKQS